MDLRCECECLLFSKNKLITEISRYALAFIYLMKVSPSLLMIANNNG